MSDAKCDRCSKRPAVVVFDQILSAIKNDDGTPYRHVYRMCQWCRAIETKSRQRLEATP